LRYNPALDGIRALAIILVFCNHMTQFVFPIGGWIGVDVFFVLSGYLITSILLRELRETGKISFLNFYARRALRLFPALAILAIVLLVRSFLAENGPEIREAILVAVAYIENWNMLYGWWPIDYWGATWSLSVEEQFYLLWPLTLLFIVNKRPLIWVAAAVIGMTVAELLFWRGGRSGTEHTLQFSLVIRPVGLLIGIAIAFLPISRWRMPPLTAPAMLLAIGLIALTADRSAFAFLSAPLAASLVTAILVVCTHQPGAVTALLSAAPIRYIGKISYGLYLYHLPIFLFAEEHKVHLPFYLFGVGIIVSIFAAAILSYEFVEKPILGLKGRFQRQRAEPQPEGLKAV
jgi:peptidoglycan/LPS O-acetylase OafA/YrhL